MNVLLSWYVEPGLYELVRFSRCILRHLGSLE